MDDHDPLTNETPDVIAPAEPELPAAGPLTEAWIASCADADDADRAEADARDITSGTMTLTPEDLKQVRNADISAITHSADVAAWFAAGLRAVLTDMGVLTTSNYRAQVVGPLDDWNRDRSYEANADAVRDKWLAGGSAPPPPKQH